MEQNNLPFKFSLETVLYPFGFVMLLWLIFALELRFNVDLTRNGIYPKTVKGLQGILFSPFIHSGITHLYHNSVPLFILSTALFYFYRPIAWKVILYGIILSGAFTWLIGRPSWHIGASGLIYVLFSFIFFKGILAKHYRLIALSFMVIFLYGSMIWYAVPIEDGISWEGHLSGLIVGLLFALIFRKEIAKPKKFNWEEPSYNEEDDDFLKHFDENGNFIEQLEPEAELELDIIKNEPLENNTQNLEVHYIFKKNEDKD